MDKRNVTKWIFASIAKHFNSLSDDDVYVHISGQLRETDDKDAWVEVKIDGPYITKLSKGYHNLKIEISVQSFTVQKRDYLYNNLELQGKVLDLFTESIGIYKLGNKSEDDKTFAFCILLDHNDKHTLDVANYGAVDENEKIKVSGIEGHYYAKIKNF